MLETKCIQYMEPKLPRDFDKFTTISVFSCFSSGCYICPKCCEVSCECHYYNAVVNPRAYIDNLLYDFCTALSPSDFDSVVTQ